jgi:signal transduction histidine kinase
MNSQVSSVGWNLKFEGLEVDARSELPSHLELPFSHVLILRISTLSLSQVLTWLKGLHKDQKPILIVHLDLSYSKIELYELINSGFVHTIIEGPLEQKILFEHVRSALVELRNNQQNIDLVRLVKEQNEKLKVLYYQLESRIVKRQTELSQSRLKKQTTNRREQALQEGLIAIFKSKSMGEIEVHLVEVLKSLMSIELVRIFMGKSDQHLNQNQLNDQMAVLSIPLFSGSNPIGSIYFFREFQLGFTKQDYDFLSKLTEAVDLSLHRISTLQEAELISLQWNATFDAISDPLVILTKDFEILQANKAADHQSELIQGDGKKCFQLLFKRDSPCFGCRMGHEFRIKDDSKALTFEVSSHPLPAGSESDMLTFVHLYRDVTDQLRIEKQILESSKLTELGTIGSSIAHELNNPIGGILNFAQLIKMDITAEDPLYGDVCAIEEGARKCRDIIQNLLTFARNPDSDQIVIADLIDILTRATKIIEIKSKSKGVQIELHLPKESGPLGQLDQLGSLKIKGHINLLTQAFQNILQNSIESIEVRLDVNKKVNKKEKYLGKIILSVLNENSNFYTVKMNDNGVGISPSIIERIRDPLFTTKDQNFNPGLGLTIADRIIQDHDGSLEIESVEGESTTVSIHLPRLVLG